MKQFDAEILENRELAGDGFELRFAWPAGLRAPLPGQVVTIGTDSTAPFLRRPFPVASFHRETRVASLFVLEGNDPQHLSRLRPGDTLDVLGPRGFAFQAKPGRALLVGGGHGTGSLVFAAASLAAKGVDVLLVLGYARRAQVPRLELDPRVEILFATEDGSLGFHGGEADCLRTLPVGSTGFVWAAAPRARLKAIHEWSVAAGVPCQVSVEQIIACGVGACLGCTVATTDKRQVVRVCTEGPVFSSEVIDWTSL